MTSARSLMSAVDRAWLRMDTPQNPMMICAVLILEQPVPMPRLRQLLEERFLRFRRFRQRIVEKNGKTWWQDDPLFDLDNHLHCIALPGRGGQKELQELAGDLNSTALDFRRPLWQIHYIDGYNGGCALLVRIHHCIADGISLVRVLLSLTDQNPDSGPQRQPAQQEATRPSTLQRLLRRTTDTLQTAAEQSRLLYRSVRRDPAYLLKLGATAGAIAMDVARLGLSPFEPETGLRSSPCGRKRVAWADPLALSDVKACARRLGGTVNDVLLCAATGALQRHFREVDEPLPEQGIRVAVPFNLRPLNQPITSLGNQFGLVLAPLPLNETDPIACFRRIQHNMNQLKRSYQAQVTYSLLDLFGRGPDILERRALELLSHKSSAVLTNVPGPKEAVYLAGSKLLQPLFWVPQSGSIGIGMSILSYAGSVQFGISIDKSIAATPDAMTQHFRDAFSALRRAAGTGRSRRRTGSGTGMSTKRTNKP